MSNARKPRRARSAEPSPTVPTERQMDAALAAFDKSKLRHQLLSIGERVAVRILPDLMLPTTEFMGMKLPPVSKGRPGEDSFSVRYFVDEAAARQWREREIIKEAVTAALRAKP